MSPGLSRRRLFTFDWDTPRRSNDHWVRVHRTAMACRFEITLDASDAVFVEAARAALNEADRIEALLTVFRDSSEVSRVNREASPCAEAVDLEVCGLLQRSAALHADTDGAFDITSTPLSRCWGFLKREGRVPSAEQIETARASVGMTRVFVDPRVGRVRFDRAGVELNFGAIGKGYALDRMGRLVRARGVRHALLSAGSSSVLAVGGRRGGWTIDLGSPRIARSRIARVRLRDGALGTSGAGEQFVIADGRRYGHVIDPRTGWPASGVISVSVIAREAERADALSTAFLVGGLDLASRYCTAHPDTMAVLTLEDGAARPRVCGSYDGATLEA